MPTRLRQFINGYAGVLGLASLIGGLLVSDTGLWRLLLLLGLWLLSLPLRRGDSKGTAAQRGLGRLLLVFGLAFLAVGLQLARDQVSQAGAIRERMAALQQPAAAQNPGAPSRVRPVDRTALGDGRVWPVATGGVTRGRILGRDGTQLAITKSGRRVYPNP